MLPKAKRLRLAKDYQHLYAKKRSIFSTDLVLHFCKNEHKNTRFGFIVANKVAKQATVRNRLKRQMRAWARLNLAQCQPGFDIIINAKTPLLKLTYQELSSKLTEICKKAKLIT